ncbi:MAG: SDR family oxidoreductase [Leptospira sp.]|nr:SDR family oxidoreductase [Leptospira sp.]
MKSKIVLVTGSSRGIGEAIFRHLKSKGYKVFGSSRSPEPTPNHFQLDVTNPMSCQNVINTIVEREGRLDVLINNAGFHLTGACLENSLEELQSQMNLNFYGAVHMIRASLPIFLQQKSGNIINMSSLGGLLSLPFTSAYNASKFALEGYTEALRLELLPLGIYVSNLEPGYVNSGTIEQSIGAPQTAVKPFSKYREILHKKMESESLTGSSKESIAKTIEGILNEKKPSFRYKIGGMSKFLPVLQRILPDRSFEKNVLSSFGLPLKIDFDPSEINLNLTSK